MTQAKLMDELLELEARLGFELDYIRFSASDIHGIPRGHIVPRRHAHDTFKSGVSLFAGIVAVGARTELTPIKEVIDLHLPNCRLLPATSTIHYLPWAGKSNKNKDCKTRQPKIGQVICEYHWVPPLHKGLVMEADGRHAAQRQLDRLSSLGLTVMSAFETEFILLDVASKKPVFSGLDAATILRLAGFEDFLCELESDLHVAGVDLEGVVVEHGEGQFELGMQPVWDMEVCDALMKIKMALKEKAQQRGWIATMMARPSMCSTTNGLHLNQSLWSTDRTKNRFYDAKKKKVPTATLR